MTDSKRRGRGGRAPAETVDPAATSGEIDRYLALLETLPAGLTIHVGGTIAYANPAMYWMLGVPLGTDVKGWSILDWVHPDFHAETVRRVQTMFELSDSAGWWELQFVRADGTAIDVEVASSVIEWQGQPASQVLVNEIGERKAAERQLRASEARYRALIESMPLGIAVHAGETIVFANEVSARLVGAASPAAMVGRAVLDFVHEDDRSAIADRIETLVRQGGQMPGLETRLVRADGGVVDVETAGALIEWDGEPAVQVVLQDVGERNRLQQRLQHAAKHESLTLLAGGVAHDFNNLLVGILGNADLARLDLHEEAPTRTHLDDISLAARRAADLARQMLAYAGKGRVEMQRVDVGRMVEDSRSLLESAIDRRAELETSLGATRVGVEVDLTQLRQVLLNLVTNAAEAIGDRGGRIAVSAGVRHLDRAALARLYLGGSCAPGRYAWLEVADDGPGIPAHEQGRIFDPFYSTKFTGRGLGLASVVGIVRAHGGAIQLDSAPGRGTRFRVLLPALAEGEVASIDGDEPRAAAAALADPGEGTVLVVDDEEVVREVGATILRRAGFTVETASRGDEAVAMVRRQPDRHDAIVLDLTMPGMDGGATLTALRALRPDVRVVLTSGYDPGDVLSRLEGDPPAAFVQKPFKVAALVDAVRRAID